MKTKIVYLKPLGAYNTHMRSDTLWGILCWGIRLLYGKEEVEKFIEEYRSNEPTLVLSSVFVFRIENGEKVLFFPNPVPNSSVLNIEGKTFKNSLIESKRHKTEKELRYICLSDFEAYINSGRKLFKTLTVDHLNEKKAPATKIEMVTHTTIDRITLTTLERNNMGQLFHENEIYVKDANPCGLYFLAKGNEKQLDRLESVMRFFTHMGIGGNTSTGKGFFNIECADFELNEPNNANALINLSLYQPTDTEIHQIEQQPSLTQYELVTRQGRTSGIHQQFSKKKPILYFKEGSVFPKFTGDAIPGKVQEAQFESNFNTKYHKIYQNGKGFMVNLKLNEV